MKVLSKMLWAIDLNTDYNESIDQIRDMSAQFGYEITLLHVLPKHINGGKSQIKIEKSLRYELEKKFVERLQLNDKHVVRVRIEVGDVAERVNKVAKEEKVDAIILNKGKKEKLGTNGNSIFRKTKKPILVISDNKTAEEPHIVCPVDNSKASTL